MHTVEQTDEAAARKHYWKRNPDVLMAECSRPKEVIAFIEGCKHKTTQFQSLISNASDLTDYQKQQLFKQINL